MKPIIIISICSKIKVVNKFEREYIFHFKGVYSGHMIKEIKLKGKILETVEIDEEYLIYLNFLEVKNEILFGEAVKVKRLDQCFSI